MRKTSIFLSMIVMIALLLTACGGEETRTNVPSTNVPPVTMEATSTEAPVTEAPTSADLTTTPGVPVTGQNNPSRATNMMSFVVLDQNGNQVGTAQDLVLDLDNTRVSYVVVMTSSDMGNKTVLIPWDSLQVQTSMSSTSSASGQQNAFVLLADPEFLKNAPNADLTSIMPGMGEAANNWDADIRNFWQSGAVPGGTQAAPTSSTGGTSATAVASSTAMTLSTATSTSGTSNGAGTATGTGRGLGQVDKLQGVLLASDVIGTTVMIGVQANGQGQGLGQSTSVPSTTNAPAATMPAGTALPGTTATSTSGNGTGTGNGTATGNTGSAIAQATVEDLMIDTATGDIMYLVIRTSADETRWIPVPIGFLRWDGTNFVLMINGNALENAPAFTEDQFPDTSSTGWDQEFSDFWQNNGGTSTGTGTVTSSTATAMP